MVYIHINFISFWILISHALFIAIILFSPFICLLSLLFTPSHSKKGLINLNPHFKTRIMHLSHFIAQNLISCLQNSIMTRRMIRRRTHCLHLIDPIPNYHLMNPKLSKLHLIQIF